MTAALSLQGFAAGTRQAAVVVSGISFAVHPGEAVALLGANGAGKTTLLRAIAGLAPELGGALRIFAAPAPRGAAARVRAGIALSFQNPDDQLFGATVAEDVAVGPRQRGLSEDEIRSEVREALQATDLLPLADSPIDALSFGEKRRACLAGVLAMHSRILLLDEPTSGLDPRGERQAAAMLERLVRERGIALLAATHAIDLVPSFASRVVLLGEGRMLLDADCRTAFARKDLLDRARLRPPFAAEVWARLMGGDPARAAHVPLTSEELASQLESALGTGQLSQEVA